MEANTFMPESENDAALSSWSAPECPFRIQYSPRALDDIRLAVVDAFFSLPRGGAEIGGILCGNWDGQRLTVTDYAALDCEHAFGPSFTLSPRDEARLADLLAASAGNGPRPVGWYHSHTRSEIFLSDADQDIHRRFFPEPWQVALVLRPHTFHPTRAGFFFRDASGGIQGAKCYAEFALAALAVKPAPSPDPVPEPTRFRQSAPLPVSSTPAASEEPVAPLPPPAKFPAEPERPFPRSVAVAAAALAACGVLGAAAYWKRGLWLPRMRAMAPSQASASAPLGLNTVDIDGQLQIRWNPNSPAVQRSAGGVLSIYAGSPFPQEVPLDKAHLLSGVFTFGRQTERVDVRLDLTQPGSRASREVTTFMGRLPDRKPAEDPAVKEERDKLAKQVEKIQSDLNVEIERNANLRKSVDQLSKQLREQQRGRLLNQAPDKK